MYVELILACVQELLRDFHIMRTIKQLLLRDASARLVIQLPVDCHTFLLKVGAPSVQTHVFIVQ
jgi:hypothetical protein